MTKQEFLEQLREKLSALPSKERSAALQHYEDIFRNAVGESEEEVIQRIGSPDSVAEEILKTAGEKVPPQSAPPRASKLPPWALILLGICFIALGIPFIAAVGGGLIGLAGALAGVLLSLIALVVGLFTVGAMFFYKGLIGLFTSLSAGFMQMGCGLLALGVSIALVVPALWVTFTVAKHLIRFIVGIGDRVFKNRGGEV